MAPIEQQVTRTRHLRKSNHSEDYTDFIIKVGPSIFPVHKVFLGKNCTFFHEIFSGGSNDGSYEFTEHSPDTVEVCLLYMYTNELEIGPHNVIDVMDLANHLNLTTVKNQCEKFLKDNLNLANCIQMRILSTQFSLSNLGKATNHVIINNARDVAQLRDLGDMSSADMRSLIKGAEDDLEDIWILFQAWSNCTKHKICRATKEVPFDAFTIAKFREEVSENEHIMNCEDCRSIAAHQFLGSNKSIPEDITPNDLAYLKVLARAYVFDEVEDLVLTHIKLYHEELFTNMQILNSLDRDDLIRCISDINDMCRPQEFTAIIQWMKNNPERQDAFQIIFRYVENPTLELECTFLSSLCVFVGFSESQSTGTDDDDNYWFPQHCLFLKELAKKYGCKRTECHVDECIIGEFVRVSQLPEFVDLEAEDIQKYLSSRSTYDSGGEEVWESVMKWFNHDLDNRRHCFEDVFAALKLDEFSEEFLANEVVLNDLVVESKAGIARILRESLLRRHRS